MNNPNLVLVHISDLHISNAKSEGLRRLRLIPTALNRTNADSTVVLCLTGDISKTGDQTEFSIIAAVLKEVLGELKKAFRQVEVACVSGNHDCLLPENDKLRERILSTIEHEEEIDFQTYSQLAEPQKNFRDFQKELGCISGGEKESFNLITHNGEKIGLTLLNSAITSKRNEIAGTLFSPKVPVSYNAEIEVMIALFHHPLGWYHPTSDTKFRKYLDGSVDIALCGHAHSEDEFSRVKEDSNTWYFEGSRFSGEKESSDDGFKVIEIDSSKRKLAVLNFKFENGIPLEKNDFVREWRDFRGNGARDSGAFDLKPDFERRLSDLGLSIKHPFKGTPTLEDLFVFPRIQRINADPLERDSERQAGFVTESELSNLAADGKSIIISGEQDCGKTSLGKWLYRDLFRRGYLPLMLSAQEINLVGQLNERKIRNLVNAAVERQYSRPDLGSFLAASKDRRIIFIDDFSSLNLNASGLIHLFSNLRNDFVSAICFSDTSHSVIQLFRDATEGFSTEKFRQFEIIEMGKKMRLELVSKWLKLGREYVISETQLIKEMDEFTRQLEVVLGTELLPSYPINILFILSQISSLGTSSPPPGTYAKFIEILINESFISIAADHSKITTYETILSQFAAKLEGTKTKRIGEDAFRQFILDHNRKYALNLDASSEFLSLQKINILSIEPEGIGFKYQYLRSYFYALHLSSHFKADEFAKKVDELISSIHLESNSNVLVFLGSRGNGEVLLEALLKRAKNLWSSHRPFQFEKSYQILDTLAGPASSTEIALPNSSPLENRKKLSEIEDRLKETQDNSDDKRTEESKLIGEINSTIRLLHVMGQLVRTYHGKMESPRKDEIVKEASALMLRLNQFIFDEMHKDVAGLHQSIRFALKKKKGLDEDSAIEDFKVKEVVFRFIQLVSLGIAKRFSIALGHKNLAITFQNVFGESKETSARLYHLAVKLDHFDGFPENQILELDSDLEGNAVARGILQYLVASYLTVFSVSESLKQKICAKLKIAYGKVKAGGLKTIEAKR